MKGQISYIGPIFTLLLAGILAGALAVIPKSQITQVTPVIEAEEFENRALILANSLLANKDLIYSDGVTYYRGVFNDNGLDKGLFKGSSTKLYPCNKSSEGKCKIISYPDSYALIVIKDLKDGTIWFTGTNKLPDSSEAGKYIGNCFMSKDAKNLGKLFDNSDFAAFLELDKCSLKRYSVAMNSGFPVSIRYSGTKTNMGLVKVLVVE